MRKQQSCVPSLIAVVVAGTLFATTAAPLSAEPLPQTSQPVLTVSPATAAPGELVRVAASGFGRTTLAGATACIGFLGPGQNLELGLSPSFRVRLGTLTVDANGFGTADVHPPVQAALGTYRITIGGCSPQPDLAPLATVAETSLTLTRAATGLPATGGAPTTDLHVATAFLLTVAGTLVAGLSRRRRLHS